jgi:hypothetical protein
MSDDLKQRLRSPRNIFYEYAVDDGAFLREAADRIEELEAENRLLRDAVYIDDLTVTMQANDRSKALAVIGRALDFLAADMPSEAKTALRTILAELTGGKDDNS